MDQVTIFPVKRGPFVAGTLSEGVVRATVNAGVATFTANVDAIGQAILTFSDTAAITIANPIGTPTDGQMLSFLLLNSSGGVQGTITWGNKFKVGTVTKPANGQTRTLSFFWDATLAFWRQIDADRDVPV